MNGSHDSGGRAIVSGAALSALFVSALDVHAVGIHSRLLWGAADILLLLTVVFGLNFCLVVSLSFFRRRAVGRVGSFWFGLVILGLLYAAEWWLRAPPPHVAQPEWRGEWWGLVAGVLIAFAMLRLLRLTWARRLSLAALVPIYIGVLSGPERLAEQAMSAAERAPNVLVVSVDTLRADHLGVYGNETVQTPNVDALALSGVLFEHAFAPIAVTGPSHAALLTGAGPWSTGMLLNGVGLPEKWPTLATLLREQGYATGAFVSAYVLDGALGFDRGFEIYDSSFGALRGIELTSLGRVLSMLGRQHDPHDVLERSADATVDQALTWLAMEEERPFFAWVHLFDPHGPYAPPPPWNEAYYEGDPRASEHTSMDAVSDVAPYLEDSLEGIRDVAWVKAQYAGEVSFVDAQFGRLLAHLSAEGVLEDTIIVFVGDHGESLGEAGVWFNHGGDLEEAALKVPMVLAWPGHIPAEERVETPVGLVDVAPTILSLLDVELNAQDGLDLGPLLANAELNRGGVRSVCFDRSINLAERAAGRIVKPTYLLGRVWTASGWVEIGSHPDRGAVVRGAMDPEAVAACTEMIQGLSGGARQPQQERSEQTIERLKALGYVE